MQRLLQGDVGSGKTIVAAVAAAQAVEAGAQVAVMAPTELLAEQTFRKFEGWFAPAGVEVAWRICASTCWAVGTTPSRISTDSEATAV
jgi:ATP-dependent DNA helicase RecG